MTINPNTPKNLNCFKRISTTQAKNPSKGVEARLSEFSKSFTCENSIAKKIKVYKEFKKLLEETEKSGEFIPLVIFKETFDKNLRGEEVIENREGTSESGVSSMRRT